MLTKKIFKKMFITSSIIVIILLIYLMPGVIEMNNNKIKTSVKYVDLTSSVIYLLDDNGLLVESTISVINDGNLMDQVKSLIKNLSDASEEIIPNGLNSVMPSEVQLLDVKIDEHLVDLNFSKEMLKPDDKSLMRLIEAISFTLLNVKEINGVGIYVDGTNISELVDFDVPYIITKDFGINKHYDINNTGNIVKYVIYYSENIDDNTYYVPITKYINSSEDKINIIIEDLSSSYIYQPNLISIASEKLELINYDISTDEMTLNFNNSIFLNSDGIKEEVAYPVINTIFSNFEVNRVVLQINGKEILKKDLKNIE